MTSSECAFETESLVPIGYTPEAFTSGTLQRSQPRHILLRQSPGVTVGTGVSSNCNILHHDVMELGVGGTAVEMVPISTVGGQEEQRSDSGRGASDEEAMFQTAFQPILCGVQTANGIKIAVPTDQNGTSLIEKQMTNRIERIRKSIMNFGFSLYCVKVVSLRVLVGKLSMNISIIQTTPYVRGVKTNILIA